ncbi:phosphinothricin N-acetyltransferase protein [Amylostereum chailletii]|nr:phosphinothricin N-acetyltransferase protein [Amylostereum chailletii]
MAHARPAVIVRDAREEDLPAVHTILTHYILTSHAIFIDEPQPFDETRAKYASVRAAGMPYLVATLPDPSPDGPARERVVGYTYVSPYHPRPGYRLTLENTIYLAPDHAGMGIGGALLSALIAACERGPWRTIIASIGDAGGGWTNRASIGLHEKFGFRHVGRMGKLGVKLGRWVDVVYMQLDIGEPKGEEEDSV